MKFRRGKKEEDLSAKFENMWYPGFDYIGRTGEYSKLVTQVDIDDLVKLVQGRAQADGEWNIANGFVGDNEDAMRQMMAWTSNETNIRQCVEHILKIGEGNVRTVEWICRDLANASKWIHGTRENR
jgi:hypothetical protein